MDNKKNGMTGRLMLAALVCATLAAPARAQTVLFQEPDVIKATMADDYDELRSLLGHGESPDKQGREGRTALILAAVGGQIDIVELLLAANARVNVGDDAGTTALGWAASQGHAGVVRLLIAAGARIDVQNRQGLTPLIFAAKQSRLQSLELLIEAGADLNIVDFTGRGALGWARNGRDPRIEQTLEQAGARD